MGAGDRFPPEWRRWVDPPTGAAVVQLTGAPCVNHTPYFLNRPWASRAGPGESDSLIVTSYRDRGRPNLFAVAEASGELLQLTGGGDVNPWSACVSADGRSVYFGAGREVRVVEVATTRSETLAVLPPGTAAGGCSLSPDGDEVVAPLTGEAAREGGPRGVLLAVRTDGTGSRVVCELDQPIGHAQFSPDGRRILFAADLPRLWLVDRDGHDPHPLRDQTRREWLTHESWLDAGEVLFVHWPHALKAIRADGTGERTVAAFNGWHPAPRADGTLIVCDTALPDTGLQLVDPASGTRRTLCYPRASCRGYQWARPEPVWDGPVPEEAYGPQWTHPHPSFSPDGRAVAFTSDASGHPQVHVAYLPPDWRRLPPGAPDHARERRAPGG
jgi:oligogalacturonide lyase